MYMAGVGGMERVFSVLLDDDGDDQGSVRVCIVIHDIRKSQMHTFKPSRA